MMCFYSYVPIIMSLAIDSIIFGERVTYITLKFKKPFTLYNCFFMNVPTLYIYDIKLFFPVCCLVLETTKMI